MVLQGVGGLSGREHGAKIAWIEESRVEAIEDDGVPVGVLCVQGRCYGVLEVEHRGVLSLRLRVPSFELPRMRFRDVVQGLTHHLVISITATPLELRILVTSSTVGGGRPATITVSVRGKLGGYCMPSYVLLMDGVGVASTALKVPRHGTVTVRRRVQLNHNVVLGPWRLQIAVLSLRGIDAARKAYVLDVGRGLVAPAG